MITSKHYPPDAYEALDRFIGFGGDELRRTLNGLLTPYETFQLPKGGPGFRRIEAPVADLRQLQRAILDHLLYKFPIPPDCHGFVPGRSIVTNARSHLGQRQLVSYDISEAFPSVSRQRVEVTLTRRLGGFLKHRGPRLDARTRTELISLLADLTTHRDGLPQGAPTSGALLNLALAPMDRQIRRAIQQWREEGAGLIRYTRYADDLTLSAGEEGLPEDAEAELRRAIIQAGFRFNPHKTERADRRRGQPLVICGLHVDGDQLRLPRRRLRRYRAILHRASQVDELTATELSVIFGIAGLVRMVYHSWPPSLAHLWRLTRARHGLSKEPPETQELIFTGYGFKG